MARNGKTIGSAPAPASEGITRISVAGFKSIREEQSIEIRPLTILAGANSSGKSSIMQPLLLMKQTIESRFDPEIFQIDGSNVKFKSIGDFLPQQDGSTTRHRLSIGFGYSDVTISATYDWRGERNDFSHVAFRYREAGREMFIAQNMEVGEAHEQLETFEGITIPKRTDARIGVYRDRCFLGLGWLFSEGGADYLDLLTYKGASPTARLQILIHQAIHVPGVRAVQSSYPVTQIGISFPGIIDYYVGSAILYWIESNSPQWQGLIDDVNVLSIANYVTANRLNDAEIQVRVNRAARSSERDTVNIASVGIGVSQALPVLVALRVARQGQLVYIEQPELHLHPRAQVAMAKVLADAAIRGVRVVIETHSSLLLLAVQTLVAEGKLDPKLVALHWFSRDDAGNTKVDSADLDEAGAFGDWPEDFGTVELKAQDAFLSAAEERLTEMSKNGQ